MRRFLCWICLSTSLWSAAVAADLETVGALGDPDRWEFAGDRTYEVAVLRSALAADFEVLVASRPQESLDRFLDVLRRTLERGYQSSGYAEPRVAITASPSHDRLVCDIAPGRQYITGRMEIHGARRISEEALRDALTKDSALEFAVPLDPSRRKQRPAVAGDESVSFHGAFWVPGDRANFSPFARDVTRQAVISALRRVGWFDPTLDVMFRTEADGTATLVIEIADEGIAAVLGEIEVQGLIRNTREALIEYLALKPGQPLNARIEAHIRARLQQTHRFLKTEVEILPPPFGEGACRLILKVVEAPEAPVFGEAYSPIQQRALRAAESIPRMTEADWETFDQEPLPSAGGIAFTRRVHVCPAEGLALFEVIAIGADGRVLWHPRLVANNRRIVLLSGDGCSKLELPLMNNKFVGSIRLTPQSAVEKAELIVMNFSFGLNKRSPGELPLKLSVEMEPLAALRLVSQSSAQLEDSGDETVIRAGPDRFMIDRASGDFREMFVTSKANPARGTLTVSARPGRLRAAWPELEAAIARAKSSSNPDQPLTSLLRFGLSEGRRMLMAFEDPVPPALEVCDRLLGARALESLDRWMLTLNQPDDSPERPFIIRPVSKGLPDPESPNSLASWTKTAWYYFSRAVPRDTPLWVMGREAMFLLTRPPGIRPATPTELATMLREAHAGPIHFAMATSTFGQLHPAYRIVLADAGLNVLHRTDYLREMEFVVDEQGALGQVLRSAATAMRDVHDADLALLTARFGPPVQEAVIELRQRSDEPLNTVLIDVAERLWEPVVKPLLAAYLGAMAKRSPEK